MKTPDQSTHEAQGRVDPATSPPPLDHDDLLVAQDLHKQFVLHHQGGICLPVLTGVSLRLKPGECVALLGASGSGKSTFMRSLYGNYRIDRGAIWVRRSPCSSQRNSPFRGPSNWVNLPQLEPHELLELRRHTIGYVSQFLRVIPRVSALTVAAEPLLELGKTTTEAEAMIRPLFQRLNLPERLWSLSPTTFSGGEKQRVNIARAFAVDYPLLLLDEPTSALDAKNREVVIELIQERKAKGHGLVGIFHDDEVRQRVCNRALTFTPQNGGIGGKL